MIWPKTNHLAGKTLYYNALPSYLNLAATSHTGTENKSAKQWSISRAISSKSTQGYSSPASLGLAETLGHA